MKYFNSEWYLAQNQDVARAIASNLVGSAEEHFELYGRFEGRNPMPMFGVDFYLAANPDVAEAVRLGETTAYDHFVAYGSQEGRIPNAIFNAAYYLSNHDDVRAAVENGDFTAFDHFVAHGTGEARAPNYLFNAAEYLAKNADVAAAVEAGVFSSAFEHYLLHGASESRAPSSLFNSAAYLDLNPDVRAAGVDALEHFLTYGSKESRVISSVFDSGAYLRENPDVMAAVEAGQTTAYEHFINFGLNEARDLGNGINLEFFANDATFTDALAAGDISALFGRVQEVAPFIPGYAPPAGYRVPANTPVPTDFTPPPGKNLVIPDHIDVDEDNLPDSVAETATFKNGQLVIAAGVEATVTIDGEGNLVIKAPHLRASIIERDDVKGIELGEGARFNISSAAADGFGVVVSGDGAFNVFGVEFGDITKGNLEAPDLSGIAFEELKDTQYLLSDRFTVNDSVEGAFTALWIAFDSAYYSVPGGNYYDLPLNTLKVNLANSYVEYLEGGNPPLLAIVQAKVEGSYNYDARQQSLHDNMLGEVTNGGIADRFPDSEPRTAAAIEFGDRPYSDGKVDSKKTLYDAQAWDFAKQLERPDYPDFEHVSRDSDGSVAGANGFMFTGSGNYNTDFHTIQHDGYGIKLGLKGAERGSGVNKFDEVDDEGIAHYSVDAGTQTAGYGPASSWSFYMSIEVGSYSTQPDLTDYRYVLKVDLDPTIGTDFLELEMVVQPNGKRVFMDGRSIVLADDMNSGHPASVYQQSVNWGFAGIENRLPEGYDFATGGIFDVVLEAYLPDAGHDALPFLSTGIVIHADSLLAA